MLLTCYPPPSLSDPTVIFGLSVVLTFGNFTQPSVTTNLGPYPIWARAGKNYFFFVTGFTN